MKSKMELSRKAVYADMVKGYKNTWSAKQPAFAGTALECKQKKK